MATTGDVRESKDLQTMISDRNETAEMMVKRVWPRVDSWKVQWSKKLTSMRFKVRWHDDSPKGTTSFDTSLIPVETILTPRKLKVSAEIVKLYQIWLLSRHHRGRIRV